MSGVEETGSVRGYNTARARAGRRRSTCRPILGRRHDGYQSSGYRAQSRPGRGPTQGRHGVARPGREIGHLRRGPRAHRGVRRGRTGRRSHPGSSWAIVLSPQMGHSRRDGRVRQGRRESDLQYRDRNRPQGRIRIVRPRAGEEKTRFERFHPEPKTRTRPSPRRGLLGSPVQTLDPPSTGLQHSWLCRTHP